MKKLTTFESVLREFERDPEFAERQADAKPSRDAATLLVHARLELGLTQTEFARNAGVSQAYISSLESGASNPSLRSFARVLRRNGIELQLSTTFIATAENPGLQHDETSAPAEDASLPPAKRREPRTASRKNEKRLTA